MTKAVQDLMIEVERVRDAFHAALAAADVEAAVALVDAECALVNVPAGTGARGRDALRRHLAEDVVPCRPTDWSETRISRTGDRWRVVDETTVSFTHEREMPWLLPGVAPTGRHVEVFAISVVSVRRSKITTYRTLWDQVGLLEALGRSAAA